MAGRVPLQDRGRAEIGDRAFEHVLDGLGLALVRTVTTIVALAMIRCTVIDTASVGTASKVGNQPSRSC